MSLFIIFGLLLSAYVISSDIGNKYDAPIIGGFVVFLIITVLFRIL